MVDSEAILLCGSLNLYGVAKSNFTRNPKLYNSLWVRERSDCHWSGLCGLKALFRVQPVLGRWDAPVACLRCLCLLPLNKGTSHSFLSSSLCHLPSQRISFYDQSFLYRWVGLGSVRFISTSNGSFLVHESRTCADIPLASFDAYIWVLQMGNEYELSLSRVQFSVYLLRCKFCWVQFGLTTRYLEYDCSLG